MRKFTHPTLSATLAGALSFAAASVCAAPGDGRPAEDFPAFPAEARFVPGQLLVQFKPGAGAVERQRARAAVGAQSEESVTTPLMRAQGAGELELVSLPPGLAVADAISAFRRQVAVEFAEPNWIYFHDAVSNDTYYTNGSLWGMYGDDTSPANQYGSQAGEAWAADNTDCGTVYVGIIDEGYMYTHEDLAANAGKNPGEIPGNGIDDDGNGYKDDVYGWDFDGNNNSVFDGVGDDHGTHVAGTIGALGGNGKGVAGMCWKVKLMNAKFLGNNGGTTANAIKSVDYFTDLKARHGIHVVATNNSWGGGGFSQSLMGAIERANLAGILFVAAAGNGGSDGIGDDIDAAPSYPASYDNANIIAAAAIDSKGNKASFSNYGVFSVELGAPGVGVWSTVPKRFKGVIVSAYASYSGTSMSAPHVTGAAALYAASHTAAAAADIKSAILNGAVFTTSMTGKTVTGGRLNASGF